MNAQVLIAGERTQKREVVAVQSESTSILQIIASAARDSTVDIDKMKQLMDMHERLQSKAAEAAFNEALSEAQAKMRRVATDAENPQPRSRYATYAALDRAIRPIYTALGISISYDTADSQKPEHVKVLAYVARGGYSRTYKVDMPADGKGAKGGDVMTKTHAAGAANSYGMRYLLKMVFNIAIGEDDTDGNEDEPRVTDEQIANIQALMQEVGADRTKFLKWLKVDSLGQILGKNYKWVMDALEKKRG